MNLNDLPAVAHGPLDGRHIIVLPEPPDVETAEAIVAQIMDHFVEAHRAHGYTGPAEGAVPLVWFGELHVVPDRQPQPGDPYVEGWVDRGDHGPMEVVRYFPWSPHYAAVAEAIAEGRRRVVVHDPAPFGTPSFIMQRLTKGIVE